jgi:hypothetical protein
MRCCEKRLPWYASDTPFVWVPTKKVTEAAYFGGVSVVTSIAAPNATTTEPITSHQRFRTARR